MSKFRKYKCDTCFKELDAVNDTKRVFLDKCALTKGCRGTLRFVSDTDVKSEIVNYQQNPKQQPEAISVIDEPALGEFITLVSASPTTTSNEVVLGVKRTGAEEPADDSAVLLTLQEFQSKNKNYKEYIFSLTTPFSTISGKDNSSTRKILTFSTSDEISITINGKLIDSSTYTASNNIITFNDVVTYSTFLATSLYVKVLVTSSVEAKTVDLEFKRNVRNLSSGAWSNVKSMQVGSEIYDLYTCLDLSPLSINTRVTFASAKKDGSIIAQSADDSLFWLILSKEPFTPVDRILTNVVSLNTLNSSADYLKLTSSNNKKNLLCTSSSLLDVFPTLTIYELFYQDDEAVTDNSLIADDTSLNNAIDKVNSNILGPV